MAENDKQVEGSEEFGPEVSGEVAQPDFDHLAGIITDGFIGAVGGLVGTAAMTVGLFIAASLGVFDMTSFAALAGLTGLEALFPTNSLALGYVIFLAGGMLIWPLLFASAGSYLPGEKFATKGLSFGFVLWTGFVLAFVEGVPGSTGALALYAVLTLIAHFAYGFSLGAVFDYLSDRPETLV
jgi:hypothetical protein